MTANRPPGLPDFGDPPVTEVVLGVQFEELPLQSVHLGLLWNRFKDQFPKTEDQAPLDSSFERFEVSPKPRFQFRFETHEKPPMRRVWFLNKDGTELLQVQNTRFIRNWRKVGVGDQYPRYEQIRESFVSELRKFCDIVSEEGLGTVTFNQCEVTYVNHIRAGAGWTRLGEAPHIFSCLSDPQPAGLPEAEEFKMSSRYVIGDEGLRGRLHVEIEPAFDSKTKVPLYVLTLTARGAPNGNDPGDVAEFLNLGRRSIVKAFAEVTTRNMHEIWRRNV